MLARRLRLRPWCNAPPRRRASSASASRAPMPTRLPRHLAAPVRCESGVRPRSSRSRVLRHTARTSVGAVPRRGYTASRSRASLPPLPVPSPSDSLPRPRLHPVPSPSDSLPRPRLHACQDRPSLSQPRRPRWWPSRGGSPAVNSDWQPATIGQLAARSRFEPWPRLTDLEVRASPCCQPVRENPCARVSSWWVDRSQNLNCVVYT